MIIMFFYLLNKFDTLILILLIITGVLVILAFIAFDRKRRYTDVKDMKKELLLLIGSSALAMIFAFLLAVDFYHMNEISSQVENARNNLVTNSVISEKKNEIISDQTINTNPSTHRITMPNNRVYNVKETEMLRIVQQTSNHEIWYVTFKVRPKYRRFVSNKYSLCNIADAEKPEWVITVSNKSNNQSSNN